MSKKTLITKFQLDFEMNPSYEGRKLILKQMREKGLEEEADELESSVCDACLGTGEVEQLSFDSDSKEWLPDGPKKCFCKMDDEYNDQDK